MDDIEKVFVALNKQRPDGLYVIYAGPLMRPYQKRTIDFALKNRVPSVSTGEEFVDAGGLMQMELSAQLESAWKACGNPPCEHPIYEEKCYLGCVTGCVCTPVGHI